MALLIEETRTTPFVKIDKGEIRIKGRSIPEDAFEFYDPILQACINYVKSPPGHTDINIHLDYVNSGSKKFLTNILTVLEDSYLKGKSFKISWHYDVDDESMLDLGNDLKSIIKIPFQIVLTDE